MQNAPEFKVLLFSSLLFSSLLFSKVTFAQNVGIGVATPHPSARLEVWDTARGVLIPRVGLSSDTDATTIPNPAHSLLIYNTGTGGLTPAGYYYNAGTPAAPKWKRFLEGGTPADAWLTTGNAGTNPATHFLGTTDAQDLVIKTNNTEVVRITATGNVGIGTPNPSYKLHVIGKIRSDGIIETSDARLKKNIVPITSEEAARLLNLLKPVWYDSKDDKYEHVPGLIAQDVQNVLPQIVSTDEEGFMALEYTRLIPLLIKAYQDLYRKYVELKQEYESLLEEVSKY